MSSSSSSNQPPRDESDRDSVQRLAQELGMLISRSRKLIWSAAAGRLESSGESMLTWNLLGHLIRTGMSSQGELALAIAQHPAGVSRLLEELEATGMVHRQRDPCDRRRVYVEASAKGRARFEAIYPSVVDAVDQVLVPLSPAERQTLRDILAKLVAQQAVSTP